MRAIRGCAAFGDARRAQRRAVGADDHDRQRHPSRRRGSGRCGGRVWLCFCRVVTRAVEHHETDCGDRDHGASAAATGTTMRRRGLAPPWRAAGRSRPVPAWSLRATRRRAPSMPIMLGKGTREIHASVVAVVRRLGERLVENRSEAGQFGAAGSDLRRVGSQMLADDDRRVGMLERRRAGQQLKCRGGERVLVGAPVDILSP